MRMNYNLCNQFERGVFREGLRQNQFDYAL